MSSPPKPSWKRPGDPPEVVLFIKSFIFWIGFLLSTLFFGLTSFLTFPFSFRVRYYYVSRWALFNLWWLKVTCGLQGKVEGDTHIPKDTAIIFCKHQSTWETLMLQRIFPPQAWILKRELLRVPFFGWALALLEPIAIDRKAGRKAIEQVVEQGIERLQNNHWVVVFPEGTRVAPGARGRYRLGGAILAERSGFPVVPVAHNAGEFWPRHQFIKRPGTITLRIGPVITSQGKTAQEIVAAAEQWIESAVAEISTRPDLYADEARRAEKTLPR